MGLLRGLARLDPKYHFWDTVRNIKDEGDIVDGIKRTVKEDLTEDNPLGKYIYETGKYDGAKEGYANASAEYEKKLLQQANEFLSQKKDFERERNQYEALLDEYEKGINALTEKSNKTQQECEYLQQLLLMERRLRKLTA